MAGDSALKLLSWIGFSWNLPGRRAPATSSRCVPTPFLRRRRAGWSWGASPRPVPPERRARAAIRQHDAGQIAPRKAFPSSLTGAARPGYIEPRRFHLASREANRAWCSWGASPRRIRPERPSRSTLPQHGPERKWGPSPCPGRRAPATSIHVPPSLHPSVPPRPAPSAPFVAITAAPTRKRKRARITRLR